MPLNTAIVFLNMDDVMYFLGAPDEDYFRVERLVNAATARVEAFCQRKFKKRTETVTLDGSYTPLLDLGAPIVAISAVSIDGTVQATTDYTILANRGQLLRYGGWGYLAQSVVISGTFGYETVPDDVQEATLALVRFWYKGSGAGNEGLKSESIGEYSYERFDPAVGGSADIPVEVQDLLSPYRRWRF